MDIKQNFGGGFYVLRNVRQSPTSHKYLDIYILISEIRNFHQSEIAKKMKSLHSVLKDSSGLINPNSAPVYYDDIRPALTGYARIIEYVNHSVPEFTDVQNPLSASKVITSDPSKLDLVCVSEGSILLGKLDGYGRRMNANTGITEVGFFAQDVPTGKYCQYRADGTFELPEGLYEGYSNDNKGLKCVNRITIANYERKISRDVQRTTKVTQNPLQKAIDYEARTEKGIAGNTPLTHELAS